MICTRRIYAAIVEHTSGSWKWRMGREQDFGNGTTNEKAPNTRLQTDRASQLSLLYRGG